MQLVGKLVGIFWAERGWPLGLLPGIADRFHKVSHGEVLFDVVRTEKLAPVVDGVGVFGDDPIRQGNVGGDHQVAFLHLRHDRVIRLVSSRFDEDIAYMNGLPDCDLFVGDHNGRDAQAFDGPKHDGFEQIGEGVAVDVEGEWECDGMAFAVLCISN